MDQQERAKNNLASLQAEQSIYIRSYRQTRHQDSDTTLSS